VVDDTGYDAAAEVIERSMVSLPNRSTDVAVIPPAESRDLLDDLDTVLGVERINVADVPALLRELAPSWAPYRKLTGVMLRKILAKDHGITIPRAHNTWPLDPADVRRRITERAATDTRADKPEGS
jgi:S-DNA-T family DNA segregation ATPase FtsK/SpoIIIE